MKNVMKIFFLLQCFVVFSYADLGEWGFHVKNNTSKKFVEITVQQIGTYSWTWRNNKFSSRSQTQFGNVK